MAVKILRRLLVVVIIVIPLLVDMGCKKQARCGCGKDILFDLNKEPAKVFFNEDYSSAQFSPVSNAYATYYFCNPGEMKSKLEDYKSGDLMQISGHVYWECNYLYQASNYTYQMYYKVYMIQVTDISTDLYGK
ncbi:MAG: hypothetical protein RBU28_00220 [Bacteroidales bacterium]|jgi:hypothetical protein|nr:hypothetical protein [Bacteroidales bacterium]